MKRHSDPMEAFDVGRMAFGQRLGDEVASRIRPDVCETLGNQLLSVWKHLGRTMFVSISYDEGPAGGLMWAILLALNPTPPYKRNARKYGR